MKLDPAGRHMDAGPHPYIAKVWRRCERLFRRRRGTELADSCTTVKALETQYQSLITTYNLTQLDFDIEGKKLANTAGNDLRNKAIASLQTDARAAGRKLFISYTLPVNITGLPKAAVNLLQNAIQNGVNISVVNGTQGSF